MARIELDEESITVRLQGLERLWALRTRVIADRSGPRRDGVRRRHDAGADCGHPASAFPGSGSARGDRRRAGT